MATRFALRPRAAIAAAALLAASFTGIRSAPATPVDLPARGGFVDPVLLGQVETAPAIAIIAFDEHHTTRSALLSYLGDHGIQAHAFSALPIAYTCAANLDALRTLADAPGAMSVYANEPLEPALDKSVPTAKNGDPHAEWDGLGVTGKGVGVAVLDTGVDGTHPDLQNGTRTKLNVRVVTSHRDIFGPYQDPCVKDIYIENVQDSETTSGHGTHIASVAAGDGTVSGGRYTGVAPGSDIIGVGIDDTFTPVVQSDASTPPTTLSLLGAIAGINYIELWGIDAGPLVVKVILAGWVQSGLYDPWHPMALAIHDLAELGINIVFPAGNDGPQPSDCSAAATCHFNEWGASPDAITVAATPKTSRTILEQYSSRGDPAPRTFHDETFRYEPLVAAPGTNVVAARRLGFAPFVQPPGSLLGAHGSGAIGLDRRYVALTGTSVSAGHVAGAVALMQQAAVRAKGCYLTAYQVRDILRATATAIPGTNPWDVGAGAVDITSAVYAAISAPRIFSENPWMCPPAS
jgi:serine protease AprX